MGMNKAIGQFAANQKVLFKILDSTGTPSITDVFPPAAAADISVADTAQGRFTVTIKNFRGRQGKANIQACSHTTSMWPSIASRSYSGEDLTFEVSVENDASTLSDTSVDVVAEAY